MGDEGFRPDWFSKPGDTLKAAIRKRGLSLDDLAERMGTNVSVVQGLLSGRTSIDAHLAKSLACNVGGSIAFWTQRQMQFDEGLDVASNAVSTLDAKAWLRQLPIKEMTGSGWIPEPANQHDVLKTALTFFNVTTPREWQDRYRVFENQFSFRSSPSFESKLGALSAWIRQGELLADAIACDAWSVDRFAAKLSEIRELSKTKAPHYFIPRLRKICAEAGVAVVFVKAPSGCRASGATRFLRPNKAIIILSFRHLSDDHFWFTFFHEAGHLLLHDAEATFVDGDAADQTEKEREADLFSARTLVPPDQIDALLRIRPRLRDVIRFALKVGVSPGIIVGQMQHHGVIGPDRLNSLKRRYTWDEILAAIA